MPAAVFSPHVAGDLPSWLLVGTAVLVAWRVTRGGGGAAVTELTAANGVLEKRVRELEDQVKTLQRENASLTARTDFTAAMKPLLDASELHETRAAERHEKTLGVLETVAERLAA